MALATLLILSIRMIFFHSHLQSEESDSATLSDMKTAAGTDSSELADISGFVLKVLLLYSFCKYVSKCVSVLI